MRLLVLPVLALVDHMALDLGRALPELTPTPAAGLEAVCCAVTAVELVLRLMPECRIARAVAVRIDVQAILCVVQTDATLL